MNDGPIEPSADPTHRRILEAAAEVLTAQGYARATTRAIAAAAGVNEVTLFRHFGSKKNLLLAVIDHYSALPDLADLLSKQISGDYRQDMQLLGRIFQGFMAQRREGIRMVMCEADHLPELRDVMGQVPQRLRDLLAGYLRQQAARGIVRDLDPEVMAQAFFGMFFAYNIGQSLFPEPLALGLAPEGVAERFVDIFVQGTLINPQLTGAEQ
ncbi:MAG: TetR/AcrR family transcriptional regulator [Anaerolineae bacterium]|nr:TetR/AcrR family transcriptional regulator [Anaerolineae bacterium]